MVGRGGGIQMAMACCGLAETRRDEEVTGQCNGEFRGLRANGGVTQARWRGQPWSAGRAASHRVRGGVDVVASAFQTLGDKFLTKLTRRVNASLIDRFQLHFAPKN